MVTYRHRASASPVQSSAFAACSRYDHDFVHAGKTSQHTQWNNSHQQQQHDTFVSSVSLIVLDVVSGVTLLTKQAVRHGVQVGLFSTWSAYTSFRQDRPQDPDPLIHFQKSFLHAAQLPSPDEEFKAS